MYTGGLCGWGTHITSHGRPSQPALAGFSFLQQGQEPTLKVNSKELLKIGTALLPKSLKQRPVFCAAVCSHVQMMLHAEHPVLQRWFHTVARKEGVGSPEVPRT